MSYTEPKSVLVVVLDNIGDLVFSSVLFRQLRDRWPAARLSVWCKKYTEDIARLLPASPRIFAADPVWHRSPGRNKGNWPDFVRTLRALRREDFSLAIIASRPWRACASTALLGIDKRITYDGARARFFVTTTVPAPPSSQEHVIEELNRLLVPLFTPDPSIRYRLESQALSPRRDFLLQRRHSSSAYVALHAFAGDPKRCMQLKQWSIVAEGVRDRGFSPLWIGSPAELDQIRRAEPDLKKFCEFSDAYGSGSAFDDAILTSESSFFIGHDSGPLHVASGLGVPVLGLFLPSTPKRTSPRGMGPVTVLHRDSPDRIRAEEVLEAFDQTISSLHGLRR